MLMSLRVGSNDLAKTRTFYDATFAVLGVEPVDVPAEYGIAVYRLPGGVNFMAGKARDGNAATHANGGTIIFDGQSEQQVRDWHAAGIANGGTSEGDPEPKPQARGAFGAYLRDPDGNKLAAYTGLNFG